MSQASILVTFLSFKNLRTFLCIYISIFILPLYVFANPETQKATNIQRVRIFNFSNLNSSPEDSTTRVHIIHLSNPSNENSSKTDSSSTTPESKPREIVQETLSQNHISSLKNKTLTVLPNQGWVTVRSEPNQSSSFDCPSNISTSKCRNVQTINSDIHLTATGERVFDSDNRIWYVKAKFTHDGEKYFGWFDEKQTTLNPKQALIKERLAQRLENWNITPSEIGDSFQSSSYKLNTAAESAYSRNQLISELNLYDDNYSDPISKFILSNQKFAPPVCDCVSECSIKSGFGYRKPFRTKNGRMSSSNHRAWDIRGNQGTPIVAVKDGRVIKVISSRIGWGKSVYIDHGNGLVVRYSHLNSFNVQSGQNVKQGQQIATMGETGNSTGPHLDIGFILNKVPVNPNQFIDGTKTFLNQDCGA